MALALVHDRRRERFLAARVWRLILGLEAFARVILGRRALSRILALFRYT